MFPVLHWQPTKSLSECVREAPLEASLTLQVFCLVEVPQRIDKVENENSNAINMLLFIDAAFRERDHVAFYYSPIKTIPKDLYSASPYAWATASASSETGSRLALDQSCVQVTSHGLLTRYT